MPYYFHATLKELLPQIAAGGLLPHEHEGFAEPVIFVEPDEAEAAIYLEQARGAMLRIYSPYDLQADQATTEYVLFERVVPEYIDVRVGDAWVSLTGVEPP